jgi:hypothetical protein
MNHYSQSAQDLFIVKMMQGKRDGFFLEIGANDAIFHNNTYLLEKEYNWKGLMIEYDSTCEESYKIHRQNSIYEINDARLVDYAEIFNKNNFPEKMDYLQIDLDVDNKSTLDTFLLLNNTIFDKYKFATITLEHDIYSGNYFDTQHITRQILKERGYVLVFPNVSVFWLGSYKPFEDWYVHPDLVDMNFVNKFVTNESLNTEQIKELLL